MIDVFARCVVLNHLRRPWLREALLTQAKSQGISQERALAAVKQLGVIETKRHGQVWWEKPTNLVALWWYRADGSRCAEGSAA